MNWRMEQITHFYILDFRNQEGIVNLEHEVMEVDDKMSVVGFVIGRLGRPDCVYMVGREACKCVGK